MKMVNHQPSVLYLVGTLAQGLLTRMNKVGTEFVPRHGHLDCNLQCELIQTNHQETTRYNKHVDVDSNNHCIYRLNPWPLAMMMQGEYPRQRVTLLRSK